MTASPITKAPETRGPERIPVVFDPFTHCRVLMHSGDCPSEVVSAVAYDSLARELETLTRENAALRNLTANLQPGPISEAMAGARYEIESRLTAERDALNAQVAKLDEIARDNGDSAVMRQARLTSIKEIIDGIENRCMAADGPVTNTRVEMTDDELKRIYRLAGGIAP